MLLRKLLLTSTIMVTLSSLSLASDSTLTSDNIKRKDFVVGPKAVATEPGFMEKLDATFNDVIDVVSDMVNEDEPQKVEQKPLVPVKQTVNVGQTNTPKRPRNLLDENRESRQKVADLNKARIQAPRGSNADDTGNPGSSFVNAPDGFDPAKLVGDGAVAETLHTNTNDRKLSETVQHVEVKEQPSSVPTGTVHMVRMPDPVDQKKATAETTPTDSKEIEKQPTEVPPSSIVNQYPNISNTQSLEIVTRLLESLGREDARLPEMVKTSTRIEQDLFLFNQFSQLVEIRKKVCEDPGAPANLCEDYLAKKLAMEEADVAQTAQTGPGKRAGNLGLHTPQQHTFTGAADTDVELQFNPEYGFDRSQGAPKRGSSNRSVKFVGISGFAPHFFGEFVVNKQSIMAEVGNVLPNGYTITEITERTATMLTPFEKQVTVRLGG